MSPVLYLKALAALTVISLVFLAAQAPTCVLAGKLPPGPRGMSNLRLGEEYHRRRSGLGTRNSRPNRRTPNGPVVGVKPQAPPRQIGQRPKPRGIRVQG
uniref:Secreted protein n=1 Tax=Rhipicephalus zambeziensis TaxID=60191 RepID=A0A224YIJ7_9ACAR